MNNYERIKTGLLIGLVGLSMVLTWQLWTFQPDIALLDETTKYIPSEAMSEERRLADVIWPEQMIIHKQDQYAIIQPDDYRYQTFYEKLLNVSIDEEKINELEPSSNMLKQDGTEMIFPTSIPTDVFLGLFQIDQQEISLSLSEFDRLFLYVESQDERVHMRLFSNEQREVIDIETNVTGKDFNRTYLASFSDDLEAVKVNGESSDSLFNPAIYVPKNRVKAKKLSFTVSPISGEFFRHALFTDPDSVKYYRQSDNEESYTDGSRIINIRTNGLFMEYNNPVFSEARDRSSRHIVNRSFDFINGHGGWTDDYLLSGWEANELRDTAEYRLHVNHYPVISFEGINQMVLRVGRSGKQTENYNRPLFYLDSQPIDAKEEMELPSGEEVIEKLKETNEEFDMNRLEKVIIGYEMNMPSRSFVTVEPSWFAMYNGRWQKVTFEEEGGDTDGLE